MEPQDARPRLPLATPSHNGPYLGPVPVRVLPAGFSGEDPKGGARFRPSYKEAINSGHEAQSRRALMRRREPPTHCKQGHPLEGDNLYLDPAGKRRCRMCHRGYSARHRARPKP